MEPSVGHAPGVGAKTLLSRLPNPAESIARQHVLDPAEPIPN